jgi:hypothetical protein
MSDTKSETPAEEAPYKVGDVVQVEWYGAWWAAEILAVQKGKVRVHYQNWDSSWDELVPLSRVRRGQPEETAAAGPYPVSTRMTFGQPPLWAGPPTAATGGKPVGARTTLKPGDRVQVEQIGHWWAGEVLSLEQDGHVRVHYTGWDSSWDETVPRSRLRLDAPGLWESLEGRPVRVCLDGAVVLDGILEENGPDDLLLSRPEDGKRLIVSRARLLYLEAGA